MTTGADPAGPFEAIVLAAGAGARFGGAKLSHPWRGGRLIDGALGAAFAASARAVTVVTGADPGVEAAVRVFAERAGEAPRLRIVHCETHALGMGASLVAGAASLPPDVGGVFVFLGDMPLTPATIGPRLVQALGDGALAAAPVFEGRRGHPVLFSAALLPALRGLTGDEGARSVLAPLGAALALVPTDDPGVLVDIDRPEDLGPARS